MYSKKGFYTFISV